MPSYNITYSLQRGIFYLRNGNFDFSSSQPCELNTSHPMIYEHELLLYPLMRDNIARRYDL